MDIRGIETILIEHPFFQGMSREHIQLLAGCATNARFQKDEVIFRHNDEANTFFIIRDGKVSVDIVTTSKIHRVQTMGKGDVLGWSWLFPPYIRRFDAIAVESTRAFALDATCLRSKCETDTVLGYDLIKRFSAIIVDRLLAAHLQIVDMYAGPKADSRTNLSPAPHTPDNIAAGR